MTDGTLPPGMDNDDPRLNPPEPPDECPLCGNRTEKADEVSLSEYPEVIEMTDRKEDMSPDGRLELYRQKDGDVVLVIWKPGREGEPLTKQVEFCTSGGRSRNTHRALCHLMVAMEKDNREEPQPKKGGD